MNTQSRGYRILLSVGKVGSITWLFMIFGPPIGGAVYFVWIVGGFVIGSLISGPQIDPISGPQFHLWVLQAISAMALLAVWTVPSSYFLGLLPAALAGIIVGTAQIRFGQLPWAIVLLIGAGVGAFDVIIHGKLVSLLPGSGIKPETPSVLGALILSVRYIVPTFVCWRIVRNWHTEPLSTP